MSIASEITRLQNAKASLKTSINAKTDINHQIIDADRSNQRHSEGDRVSLTIHPEYGVGMIIYTTSLLVKV